VTNVSMPELPGASLPGWLRAAMVALVATMAAGSSLGETCTMDLDVSLDYEQNYFSALGWYWHRQILQFHKGYHGLVFHAVFASWQRQGAQRLQHHS